MTERRVRTTHRLARAAKWCYDHRLFIKQLVTQSKEQFLHPSGIDES